MDSDPNSLHARIAEIRQLYAEGGPKLQEHLLEQAREGISEAAYELEQASRNFEEAVRDGRETGLSEEQIQMAVRGVDFGNAVD